MESADNGLISIPGVDLSNYVRDPRSFNPIVYIHKKLVPYANKGEDNENEIKTSDKCFQFDSEKLQPHYKTKVINHDNDPVVEQTIKFAKDIIPITIPPSTDDSTNPVYYTIKSKKCQKRKKTECNIEYENDVTYEKEKSKVINLIEENLKAINTFSGRESFSRSSQNNTLDDVPENRSLCCSLSEYSEKRNQKKERFLHKCKQNDVQMIASESFEALAENLNTDGDAKIKIHLMNEKDKSLLCENIKTPVIKAIRECIQEIYNTNETNFGLQNIERTNYELQNNSKKLDIIFDKLANIEKQLEAFNDGIKLPKISKLEELEQDVLTRDSTSEEELAQIHFTKRKKSKQVMTLSPRPEETEISEDVTRKMDRGELASNFQSSSQLNIRPDHPSRIPARFCWTDVGK